MYNLSLCIVFDMFDILIEMQAYGKGVWPRGMAKGYGTNLGPWLRGARGCGTLPEALLAAKFYEI